MLRTHRWNRTIHVPISDDRRVRCIPTGHNSEGEPLYDVTFPGEISRPSVWETDLMFDLARAGWKS